MLDYSCTIIGYSGHALVVAEAAITAGLNLQFYTDSEEKFTNPYKLKYLGDENKSDFSFWKSNIRFVLGIGNNEIRNKCALNVMEHGGVLLNVIHPTANISQEFSQGVGNFFSKNVVINPMVQIGDFCIVNTNAIIEHECLIGNYVHIAPGSVLLGNVVVGEGSFIGANAVIKQGIKIGKNVTIGAGTVVIRDVPDNQTIVGNPGKVLR